MGLAGERKSTSEDGDRSVPQIDREEQHQAAQSYRTPFNILIALRQVRHLMSVVEVAKLLGKSKCTVYRMARRNQIPHMMILGSLCFDPSALELWLIKKQPELAVAARQLTLAA